MKGGVSFSGDYLPKIRPSLLGLIGFPSPSRRTQKQKEKGEKKEYSEGPFSAIPSRRPLGQKNSRVHGVRRPVRASAAASPARPGWTRWSGRRLGRPRLFLPPLLSSSGLHILRTLSLLRILQDTATYSHTACNRLPTVQVFTLLPATYLILLRIAKDTATYKWIQFW